MTGAALLAAIEGFLLGGGLIVAIGAQNAFILRQGLLKQHVFVLCLVAALSDALLIAAGVAGVGSLVKANQSLLLVTTLAGAVFLLVYALIAARRMLNPEALLPTEQPSPPLRQALAILLTFTFLNPHVYLDTVLLVGGVSALYHGQAQMLFAIGAMSASFVWFFGLGYGAAWLRPFFAKPVSWRILDGVIALVMATISMSLLASAWEQLG